MSSPEHAEHVGVDVGGSLQSVQEVYLAYMFPLGIIQR